MRSIETTNRAIRAMTSTTASATPSSPIFPIN